MRVLAILLAVAVVGVVLGAPVSRVSAGGPGEFDTCVKTNPGGGALPIKATVAAEVRWYGVQSGQPIPPYDVHVTLRLERTGITYFDRIAFLGLDFVPNNTIDFVCLFLPHEDSPAVLEQIAALKERIRGAFAISAAWDVNFCITEKSISKAETLFPLPTFPDDEMTAASVADVVIYGVDGWCSRP